MPPKATRFFTVDAATGEVRCQDPSCAVTQCGQCNKEQNARRRAAKKMANQAAATAQKELEAQAAVTQARADAAAGKEHTWTYDKEEEGEGNLALQALEHGEEDTKAEDGLSLDGLSENDEPRQDRKDKEEEVFEAEKSKGKTVWNHTNRLLLWNCIQKFNPFAAPVKKDAWNAIAIEMASSTARMVDPKKGDFRVKTDGHGLEVFYARRVENMNKATSQEGKLSGQAGAAITRELAAEFAVLQSCVAKEQDAAFIKDKKRQAKNALDDIRNNKVTQLVKDAALEDPTVKARTFKLLQNRVRAAKLEAAVWEKQHGTGLGKYSYNEQQLADIEYLTLLKKDFPDDSEAVPDSDGGVERKKGGVAHAISDLVAKLPSLPAPAVDATQFAQAFFQAKMDHQQRLASSAPRKRTLAERLEDVRQQHKDKLISQAEAEYYEAEIKKVYFMQD